MKVIEVNGLRTKGKITFNSIIAIPCYKGSISECLYQIGYYKPNTSDFICVYETYYKESVGSLVDLFKKDYSLLTPVVLKLTSKVQKL